MTTAGEDRPLRAVFRHTLVYGAGSASQVALSLILVPLYTFHLTPGEFGLLALMLALHGALGRVYDLGFTNAVARIYFDTKKAVDRSGLRSMSSTALLFLFLYSALCSGALWYFAKPVATLVTGAPENAVLVRILAATLFTDALAIVPLTLIRMEERTKFFVVATSSRLAAALLLNVLFVVVLRWGVEGILLSSAITSGAFLLVLLPEFARRLGGRVSSRVLRSMLSFGLPFLPVPLSVWIIDYSDRYMLEVFASREQVGYYALGNKLAQVVGLAVVAFGAGWAPLRYRIYERRDARALYRKITSYYVVVAGFLVVGVSLLAHETVNLVAPDDYASAASVVPLLATSYALYGLFMLLMTGMGVMKRTGPIAWIAVSGAAVNIGLNLLLIPRLGMLAAAATTVIANSLLVAGAWYFSDRVYPIPLDWSQMVKILLLVSGIVAIDFSLQPAGLVAGLTLALVLVTAFGALAFVFRALRREDLQAGRRWVGELSKN